MIKLSSPFRLATEDDAAILAQLVNEAGEGLAEYIWAKIAQSSPLPEKPDPWEVGVERQAKMARDGKAIVLEAGGEPVAGLTGYAIASEPETIPDDMPEMFVPLQELENTVPDTWYINVLATLPEHRCKGHGSELLKLAEIIAISENL
ncbi:MAG: GNAT family N-acetyltransferase, partial [Pseudomonadota bacterium]